MEGNEGVKHMHSLDIIIWVSLIGGALTKVREIRVRRWIRELRFEIGAYLALYTIVALVLFIHNDTIIVYEDLGGFTIVLFFAVMYLFHASGFVLGVLLGILARYGVVHLLAYLQSRG